MAMDQQLTDRLARLLSSVGEVAGDGVSPGDGCAVGPADGCGTGPDDGAGPVAALPGKAHGTSGRPQARGAPASDGASPVTLDELHRLVVQWVQDAVDNSETAGTGVAEASLSEAGLPAAAEAGLPALSEAGLPAAADLVATPGAVPDVDGPDASGPDADGGSADGGGTDGALPTAVGRLQVLAGAVTAARHRWHWTGRRVAAAIVAGSVALAALGWWADRQLTALPSGAAFAVGGQVVTTQGYDHRLAVLEALYGMQPPSGARAAVAFRRAAAQAMVVQMVMGRSAARLGIHVSRQAATAQLQSDVTQQYGKSGGMSAFVTQLGSRGLSEADVLQAITAQIQVQQLFDRVVGTVHVSAAQVQHLYATHQAQLAVPETRAVSHIVVAAKSTADQILTQLRGGTPFATLAAKDSLDTSTAAKGGALGVVSRAELDSTFGAAAFAAAPNVPFGPVHDQYGWELGLVTQVVPGHPTTLSQAQTELQDYVKVTVEQARWDRWLHRQLVASRTRYANAYRPAHPDQPPAASTPTLGPPGQVGSLAPIGSPSAPGTAAP